MNVALDTNGYRDFMRGDPARVQIIRTARRIHLPLIVLAELRAGQIVLVPALWEFRVRHSSYAQ